jgi:hypothetical protein
MIAAALGVQPRVMTYHAFRLGVMRDAWPVLDHFRARLQGEESAEQRKKERLHAHRLECERLIEAHSSASRSELFALNVSTYRWLLAYDSLWLEARLPQRRRPHGRRGQDWTVRDAEMLRLATSVVAITHAAPEPVRVTRAAIFAGMGVPPCLCVSIASLPPRGGTASQAGAPRAAHLMRRHDPMTNPDHEDARLAGLSQKNRDDKAEVARANEIARGAQEEAQEVLRLKREKKAERKAARDAKLDP